MARQLGHADVKTVGSTYGHLAEQFREEQIRTRFSPLSADQQIEVVGRRDQLDRLWQSVQRVEWRDYGKVPPQSFRPSQSYARTSAEVLAAFGKVTAFSSRSSG